jgi:hypothetical protein
MILKNLKRMIQKHTFALLSFLRSNRANNDGEYPVYLRITVDSKRIEISTKVYVDPDKWHPGKGRVKGHSDRCRFLNNSIESFEHRAREIYNRFIEKGKIVTAESIKRELLNLDAKQRMLICHFEFFFNEMKSKEGIDYVYGTIKNWNVTLGHLKEFVKTCCCLNDITFKELELKFILDFELYAKMQWNCGSNAAIKHIQRIRKVVDDAIARNWLDKDPFYNYKGKQEKTNRTYLTQEELNLIQSSEMPFKRLEKVKDIFIFACYTGLAYVDIEKLTYDNLVIGIYAVAGVL